MIQRYSASILVGTLVTFSLFWLMQFLIATGKKAITDELSFKFVDFVRVKKEETLETKKAKPKKPPKVDEQPPDLPQPQADNFEGPGASAVSIGPVNADVDINIGGIGGFEQVDGEYLPIVKVAPIYPRRAQSRGLEGYCVLEYTVTKLGTTQEISVVECSSSLFETASVNAAAKFKYKPRVVDGIAIDTPGVRHKITFEIED